MPYNISEIKNIKTLSKLAVLDIYRNPICDIEGIENLKRLKHVVLGMEYNDNYYIKAGPLIEKLNKMKVTVTMSWHTFIEPGIEDWD